jgi:hypothetical protein
MSTTSAVSLCVSDTLARFQGREGGTEAWGGTPAAGGVHSTMSTTSAVSLCASASASRALQWRRSAASRRSPLATSATAGEPLAPAGCMRSRNLAFDAVSFTRLRKCLAIPASFLLPS